jgi:hypothetical protein
MSFQRIGQGEPCHRKCLGFGCFSGKVGSNRAHALDYSITAVSRPARVKGPQGNVAFLYSAGDGKATDRKERKDMGRHYRFACACSRSHAGQWHHQVHRLVAGVGSL